MSSLHIFSKPLSYYSANQLENLIAPDDNLLLVGDACFDKKQFRQLCDTLFILEQDAHIRAVKISDIDKAIIKDTF